MKRRPFGGGVSFWCPPHKSMLRGMKIAPNRIAVLLTAVAALLGGLAPAVANLDLQSTGGVAAGLLSLVAVVNKWLTGWQNHESNSAWQDHSRFMTELGETK